MAIVSKSCLEHKRPIGYKYSFFYKWKSNKLIALEETELVCLLSSQLEVATIDLLSHMGVPILNNEHISINHK